MRGGGTFLDVGASRYCLVNTVDPNIPSTNSHGGYRASGEGLGRTREQAQENRKAGAEKGKGRGRSVLSLWLSGSALLSTNMRGVVKEFSGEGRRGQAGLMLYADEKDGYL